MPSACDVLRTVILFENCFWIFVPALDLASERQAFHKLSTVFKRFVIAGGLISIFINNTPEILNIISVLSAFRLRMRITENQEMSIVSCMNILQIPIFKRLHTNASIRYFHVPSPFLRACASIIALFDDCFLSRSPWMTLLIVSAIRAHPFSFG